MKIDIRLFKGVYTLNKEIDYHNIFLLILDFFTLFIFF